MAWSFLQMGYFCLPAYKHTTYFSFKHRPLQLHNYDLIDTKKWNTNMRGKSSNAKVSKMKEPLDWY